MPNEVPNIVLIGPQGSGKGTQAKLLAKKFNLLHVEIGGALREIAKTKTALGRRVNYLINEKGRMVPYQLVFKVVGEKLGKLTLKQGIVFDGTPRRLVEIKPLEKVLADYGRRLTYVFYVYISRTETLKRLSKRRTCIKCGQVFIAGLTISAKAKKCPKCGGEVVQRKDDRAEAIRERLELYHRKTEPVVKYFRREKKLIEINGEQSIEKVFRDIVAQLK